MENGLIIEFAGHGFVAQKDAGDLDVADDRHQSLQRHRSSPRLAAKRVKAGTILIRVGRGVVRP
jgi:hypothetical protein